MFLTRPQECRGCELDTIGTSFSRPDGSGKTQVMLLGEALGKMEAEQHVPFVGPAGLQLKRVLSRIGRERNDFFLSNVIRCFASPKTSVLTSIGYKEIAKIAERDLVLTHQGRFKPVVHLIHNKGIYDCVDVYLEGTSQYASTANWHTFVTTEHQFQTERGWVCAEDLCVNDKIIAHAEVCIECGKIFGRHFKSHKALAFCSVSCHNKFVARKGVEKLRQVMLDAYKTGRRDPYKITEAAHAAIRVLISNGWRPQISEEGSAKRRLNSAITREALGLRGATWIGFGEREMAAVLEAAGYDYTSQFSLGGYNFDFKVGNVIVEVDGPGALYNGERKRIQPVKDALAEANGFTVLHINWQNVEEVLNVVENDTHAYEFINVNVAKLEHRKWIKGIWTLSVQDDESYVAQGVVNHNCRPPNDYLEGAPWEIPAIIHCDVHFQQVLKQFVSMKGKVIVPLGNTALHKLLGFKGILDRRAPRRGYVYDYEFEGVSFKVIPSLHPSFVLQGGQNYTGVLIHDIQKALDVAHKPQKEWKPIYIEHPTTADTARFLADCRAKIGGDIWITADIETPTSGDVDEEDLDALEDLDIERISFAIKGGEAITIPWESQFIPYIQALLALPSPFTVFWNEKFDVPRLKAKGMTIGGKVLDAMEMFHYYWCDVPKGLGFVSSFFTDMPEWKSQSALFPTKYSAMDADAQITNCYAIRDLLRKDNRFDNFVKHVVDLTPVLKKMGQSGVLIDKKKRNEFRSFISTELEKMEDDIQQTIPMDLRPFKVRRKVPGTASLGDPIERNGVEDDGGKIWDVDNNGEWGERSRFLYNSSKQVIKYLKYKGYKVPRHYKTGKETTGKDELERIWKQHPSDPLLQKLVPAREHKKMLGQYIDGFEPDPDGCIRTHFGFNSPDRLTSTKVNVKNVPKRNKKMAKMYRGMFIARPGSVLVELDWKAFQAILVGYFAQDPEYMRISRLSVHGILASFILENQKKFKAIDYRKWSDPDILTAVREIKERFPKEYDDAKHVCHGSNFGGTPKKMVMDFPESFPSMKYAEWLQNLYFSTIGQRIKKWQEDTINRVVSKTYLENPFSMRHFFWDPIRYEKQGSQWVRKWGSSAKEILSYLPRSTEAAIMRECLRQLGTTPFYEDHLRWENCDALLCEFDKDRLLNERIAYVRRVMEQPWKELGGLKFEVETVVGYNWGTMHEEEENGYD